MSHAKRSRRQRPSSRVRMWPSHLETLEIRMAPAVFAVSPSAADGAPGSLRYAINQADDNGDASNVINLAIGTYALTDATDGNLLIQDKGAGVPDKSLAIIGQGEANTIIEPQTAAASAFRVFEIVSSAGASVSVLFQSLAISDGVARNGGAVGGALALGGGLLIDGGNVTLSHVAVSNNQALGASGAGSPSRSGANAEGGGIFLASGSLTVASSSVSNNSVKGGNGGHGVTGTIGGGHTSHGAAGSAAQAAPLAGRASMATAEPAAEEVTPANRAAMDNPAGPLPTMEPADPAEQGATVAAEESTWPTGPSSSRARHSAATSLKAAPVEWEDKAVAPSSLAMQATVAQADAAAPVATVGPAAVAGPAPASRARAADRADLVDMVRSAAKEIQAEMVPMAATVGLAGPAAMATAGASISPAAASAQMRSCLR